jgi:hypothetical protein
MKSTLRADIDPHVTAAKPLQTHETKVSQCRQDRGNNLTT